MRAFLLGTVGEKWTGDIREPQVYIADLEIEPTRLTLKFDGRSYHVSTFGYQPADGGQICCVRKSCSAH